VNLNNVVRKGDRKLSWIKFMIRMIVAAKEGQGRGEENSSERDIRIKNVLKKEIRATASC